MLIIAIHKDHLCLEMAEYLLRAVGIENIIYTKQNCAGKIKSFEDKSAHMIIASADKFQFQTIQPAIDRIREAFNAGDEKGYIESFSMNEFISKVAHQQALALVGGVL